LTSDNLTNDTLASDKTTMLSNSSTDVEVETTTKDSTTARVDSIMLRDEISSAVSSGNKSEKEHTNVDWTNDPTTLSHAESTTKSR
jgi:hypothetical protein